MTDREWTKFIHNNKSKDGEGYFISFSELADFLAQERPKKNLARRESDDEFVQALKANPAFTHINIDNELSKMDAWLLNHPNRTKTRAFITTWLNKQPAPVTYKPQPAFANKNNFLDTIAPKCRHCGINISQDRINNHEVQCEEWQKNNA